VTARVVDLDALTNPERQGGVSVGGVTYAVAPMTHAHAHRIAVASDQGVGLAIVEAMRDAAREAVLSMPDAVFTKLTMDQIAAIVGISRGGAEAVEAMIAEHAGSGAGKAAPAP
jgi:hypothetical protein